MLRIGINRYFGTSEHLFSQSFLDKDGITTENIKSVCRKLSDHLVHSDDPEVKTYLQSVIEEISVSNSAVDIKLKIA